MANLQHQAIAKLELDCSEAVSVSLMDGGLWVVVEIEKDSQCILRIPSQSWSGSERFVNFVALYTLHSSESQYQITFLRLERSRIPKI